MMISSSSCFLFFLRFVGSEWPSSSLDVLLWSDCLPSSLGSPVLPLFSRCPSDREQITLNYYMHTTSLHYHNLLQIISHSNTLQKFMLGTIVYCSFFYQDWETPLGMWFLPGFERVWFHYRPWCTILTLQLREWRDENLSLGTLPWWWSHPRGALIHCLSSSSILQGPSRGMMTLPASCIAPSSHSSACTCSYRLWSFWWPAQGRL